MAIKSIATADEFKSPFYQDNEKVCKEFESFFETYDAKITGKYNAFSYNAIALLEHPLSWSFQIKKATYTSTGNLLLSSNTQSLHTATKWTANNLETDTPSFIIRRKKAFDFIRVSSFDNYHWLDNRKAYIIKSPDQNHLLINALKPLLKDFFNSERIWDITYQGWTLKIELRSEHLHLKTIQKLIEVSATW